MTIPKKVKAPNLFDNIMTSFEILQDSIIKYQMKIQTPDIYIKPELKDVSILDFHKANEVLVSVKDDVRILKEELLSHLSKKTGLKDIRDNIKDKIRSR